MKKKLIMGIGLLCVLIIIILSVYFVIEHNKVPEYTLYDIETLSEKDKVDIDKFYANGTISEGYIFDVKYDYFNSVYDSKITFLKKTKDYIPDFQITAYLSDGNEEISKMPKDMGDYFINIDDKNRVVHMFGGSVIWIDASSKILESKTKEQMQNLRLEVTYRGGKEIHDIIAPEETDICVNHEYYKGYYGYSRYVKVLMKNYNLAKNNEEAEEKAKEIIKESAELLGLDSNEIKPENQIYSTRYRIGDNELELYDVLLKDDIYYWIIELKTMDDVQYYQMELGTDNLIEICS